MTYAELQDRARKLVEQRIGGRVRVLVGCGSCGVAAGAEDTLTAIQAEVQRRGLNVLAEPTGCNGMDFNEPLVAVHRPNEGYVLYGPLLADGVRDWVDSVLVAGNPRHALAIGRSKESPATGVPLLDELDFFRLQTRVNLLWCDLVNPERIEDYIALGGYQAFFKALFEMQPEDIINEVKTSTLAGRGGAYFPTGIKWEGGMRSRGRPKYLICNSEEGEPSIFKDRRLLESTPHAVLEGMLICARAVGASYGYQYIGEHPLASARWEHAVVEAHQWGLLGKSILGTDLSFDVEFRAGFGAYVSGESSAMQASIEGKRAEPRVKLARSTDSGVFNKPTVVNNTETFASVPWIIRNGGAWFAGLGGGERNKGPKLFSLAGDINYDGLVELTMDTTGRDLVEVVGGGMRREGRQLKVIQLGGPSGGFIKADLAATTPLDNNALIKLGGNLGSGGVVALDDGRCVVELCRFFMEFMKLESCGKCVPCRIGLQLLYEILERLTVGEGRDGDLEQLHDLGEEVMGYSICALGGGAPIPLLMYLRDFHDEFEAHITEKRCPTNVCPMKREDPLERLFGWGDFARQERVVDAARARDAAGLARGGEV